MKIWRNIFTNPNSIAFAIVHWIVVLFAIYGREHSQPFHFFYEPFLTQWLYLLDFLPLIFAGIISAPIFIFFGQNPFTLGANLLLNFLLITFQWLIIGYAIVGLIDVCKPGKIKLSLK